VTSDKPRYWFPVKRYGWGWGLPVRWQGWVVFVGYLGLVYVGIYAFGPSRNGSALGAYLIVLTVLLILICAWKGEKPLRWRWGGR
jgi:drug/metabolite transporter (DMT)-like permease